ncbi:hypothetical protein TNCV_2563791 [Trichonephila clavipes]|nr:hypothetical protein TNCV_2563791 [Trichonephila clavipes]
MWEGNVQNLIKNVSIGNGIIYGAEKMKNGTVILLDVYQVRELFTVGILFNDLVLGDELLRVDDLERDLGNELLRVDDLERDLGNELLRVEMILSEIWRDNELFLVKDLERDRDNELFLVKDLERDRDNELFLVKDLERDLDDSKLLFDGLLVDCIALKSLIISVASDIGDVIGI